MTQKKLKFSIITCCKDSGNYLEETILSVIEQTAIKNKEIDVEYLIFDGNSVDNTDEIVKRYLPNYNFIKYFKESDTGLYDALTKGFQKLTGDIVAYINAGDFYYKTAFQTVNEIFLHNYKINWLVGTKVLYNDRSEIIAQYLPCKYSNRLLQVGAYGKFLPFIQQESSFWRSDLLKLIDYDFFKKLKLAGDYYLWFEFSKYYNLDIVDSYFSGFRYHKNQMTFRSGSTKKYLKEVSSFTHKKNLFDFFCIFKEMLPWFLTRNYFYITSFFNKKIIHYSLETNSWRSKQDLKEFYIWMCDKHSNTGEGNLGSSFIDTFLYNTKKSCIGISINSTKLSVKNFDPDFKKFSTILNGQHSFYAKYIYPYVGIFHLWVNFFKGKKLIYVNFLPLWNFLIFLLVPPKTILGPITGKVNFSHDSSILDIFFRKYFMKFFFKISLYIISFRYQKLIFATSLLKEVLPNNIVNKSLFDFVIQGKFSSMVNNLKKPENHIDNKDRNIDCFIYLRKYPNKSYHQILSIIKLLKEDYRVVTFGDKSGIDGIEDLGFIENSKVIELLRKSKVTIASEENIFSMFALESLSSSTIVFYDDKQFKHVDSSPFSQKFIEFYLKKININDMMISYHTIKNVLDRYSFNCILDTNLQIFKSSEKKNNDYFKDYFL